MSAVHKFGYYTSKAKYAMTMARKGCENRPFYQVVIATRKRRRWEGDIVEQLGTYDPIPNQFNEKLVALNMDRIRYWLGNEETAVSVPVLELLGYSGMLPLHPMTYVRARATKKWLDEFYQGAKKQMDENKLKWPVVEDPPVIWAKRGTLGRILRRRS